MRMVHILLYYLFNHLTLHRFDNVCNPSVFQVMQKTEMNEMAPNASSLLTVTATSALETRRAFRVCQQVAHCESGHEIVLAEIVGSFDTLIPHLEGYIPARVSFKAHHRRCPRAGRRRIVLGQAR